MTTRPVPEIPREALARMYAHARETFPKECCGFLLGSGPAAQLVVCTNRQDQLHAMDPETYTRTAETAYAIAGKEQLQLARSFDAEAPATVIYHSHCRVGAYFSEEDVRVADASGWPVDYLVIDAQEDAVRGAKLFRKDAAGAWVEIASYPPN